MESSWSPRPHRHLLAWATPLLAVSAVALLLISAGPLRAGPPGARRTAASLTVTISNVQLTGTSVTRFAASPSPTWVNETTVFVSNVSGGDPPFSYGYLGLPAGCISANLSSFSCQPTTEGNYTVGLRVTDSRGMGAFANLTLVVGAASNPPASSVTTTGILIVAAGVALMVLLGFLLMRARSRPLPGLGRRAREGVARVPPPNNGPGGS